jgi:8-oxo-dGTP pyrophosphatase MutT (NUDIX family)
VAQALRIGEMWTGSNTKMKPDRTPGCGAIGVIVQDAEFLVIERSAFVRAPGKLCFPGGSVEPGETDAQAVIRELREELRVDVRPIREIWQSESGTGIQLIWWQAEIVSSQPPVPNPAEVASYSWLTAEAMLTQAELLITNRRFLEALHAGDIVLDPD